MSMAETQTIQELRRLCGDAHAWISESVDLEISDKDYGIVAALAAAADGAERPDTVRYVLGEGYGLGKGMVKRPEEPHSEGQCKWVGLGKTAECLEAIPLMFPECSTFTDGKVTDPDTRRKFRLVLEVIDESKARGGAQ